MRVTFEFFLKNGVFDLSYLFFPPLAGPNS
jgi:hypothetical protein